MITGWLVKVVLGIAIVGFLVVEVGSPLVARAQADDAAHQVADAAALELFSSRNGEAAQRVAEAEAVSTNVHLAAFAIDAQGVVQVTVEKTARSFLFGKLEQTKRFYEVEVDASSDPQRIR